MFQVGKPVIGSQFVGREKEIELLTTYLSMGQSVVLIAPRRFGKTSLVLEALRKLKRKGYYTAFVDIFAHATLQNLSEVITGEVLQNHGLKNTFNKVKGSAVDMMKNVKIKSVVEDFEFVLGFSDQGHDPWEHFRNSIDFIDGFSKKHGKQMVFAFDEFGDLLKFDRHAEIIKMMRAKIQKQEHATYIFSGSYESVMESMFVSNKSPFYRLARIIHLGYLDFSAIKKYMKAKFREHSMPKNEVLIEDVIDLLKGHPYYCQLALQQLFLFHTIKKKMPDLDELIREMMASEKNFLEKSWEEISANRENVFVLKHLTSNPKGLYTMAKNRNINASRAVQNLAGKGILYKEKGAYYFYDPLFELWIAQYIEV